MKHRRTIYEVKRFYPHMEAANKFANKDEPRNFETWLNYYAKQGLILISTVPVEYAWSAHPRPNTYTAIEVIFEKPFYDDMRE